MARIDDYIVEGLRSLPPKPPDTAESEEKKRYSELISQRLAVAMAAELRDRGLKETRPTETDGGDSGAGRRMAGALGAKKVDITWSTEESGLLLAISIKTINFRDVRANSFQKNLINRRGDMLIDGMTLHGRFPYAVVAGFLFLDKDAATDHSERRQSTFLNAHARLKLFNNRSDPAGRDEQFERLYLPLLEASPTKVEVRAFAVGDPMTELPMEEIMDDLVMMIAERNPDFYEYDQGKLKKVRS